MPFVNPAPLRQPSDLMVKVNPQYLVSQNDMIAMFIAMQGITGQRIEDNVSTQKNKLQQNSAKIQIMAENHISRLIQISNINVECLHWSPGIFKSDFTIHYNYQV